MKEKDTKSGKINLTRREFLIGISGIILAGCEPTIRKITETLEPLESTLDTSVNETSSESGTLQPTETKQMPTETPAPEVNSLDEILTHLPYKLEVNSDLKGLALVRGENVALDFSDIKINLTYAIDKETMERETENAPISGFEINKDFRDGEIDPKRQLVADYMYTLYRSWQLTDNKKYYQDREGVSFEDYIRKASEGKDVGFSVWAREDRFDESTTKEIHLNPLKDKAIFVYADEADPVIPEKYFLFEYPKESNTLLIYVKSNLGSEKDQVRYYAYSEMLYTLKNLAGSKLLQTRPGSATSQVLSDENLFLKDSIYKELFLHVSNSDTPITKPEDLDVHTPLFGVSKDINK